MDICFISDTHFGHANILNLGSGRPFPTIRDHDEAIIERWNATVRPGDEVWHLGDFAHRCDPSYIGEVFARLNGQKHLIVGNHDHGPTLALSWASVQHYAEIKVITDRKYKLVLMHYPIQEWAGFWGKDVVAPIICTVTYMVRANMAGVVAPIWLSMYGLHAANLRSHQGALR